MQMSSHSSHTVNLAILSVRLSMLMERLTVASVHVANTDIEPWFDSAPRVATLDLCVFVEVFLALSKY